MGKTSATALMLPRSPLECALRRCRGTLMVIFGLSVVINVLLLGGPLYMMLVYDSVLPSGSVVTLLSLLALVAAVYAFQGLFEVVRSRLMADVAARLDGELSRDVHRIINRAALGGQSDNGDGLTPLRDLDSIRAFISGPAAALMDLPWIVFFLLLLSLLHIWLGLVALVGAVVLVALAVINDRYCREPVHTAAQARGTRARIALECRNHVEVIRALGLSGRMEERWLAANDRYNASLDRMTASTGTLGSMGKVFRAFLQSLMLTTGALLYLDGKASAGIIYAASLLAARALAPVDQAIANWRALTAARQGWQRLDMLTASLPPVPCEHVLLPAPCATLKVEYIAVTAPGTNRAVLRDIDFTLHAGDALGVIGPSAAGKSSLARVLVGAWSPVQGKVRLDGAALDQWPADALGQHLGYLPQQVELFQGTIGQNIARFIDDAPPETIIAAARAAGVHEMILGFDQGYATQVGEGGSHLSGGQRQRIGLARALFADPFLVVLDEPNSNLDADGEAALERAVADLRRRQAIVVMIAHRPSALRSVNKVLVLQGGRVSRFGDRDEVLAELARQGSRPAPRVSGVAAGGAR